MSANHTKPDHIIDADKLREVIDKAEEGYYTTSSLIQHLLALLPTPHTLADMTPEGREACQWMQANLDGSDTVTIISPDLDGSNARILTRHGYATMFPLKKITPRPDLPRMVWPSSEPEGVHGPTPDPEQPRTLVTTEDYRDAPSDTVVRESGENMAVEKIGRNAWNDTDGTRFTDYTMSGTTRTVLWEPEA